MATPAYIFLTEEEYENVRNSCILSAHNVGVKEGSTNGFLIFLDFETAYAHARKTYLAGQQVPPALESESIWQSVGFHFTDSQWVANLLPQNVSPTSAKSRSKVSQKSAQSWPIVGPKLAQSRIKVSPKSAQESPQEYIGDESTNKHAIPGHRNGR